MSGPSYRLQAPRPRQPPSPLIFDKSTFRPASTISSHRESKTFLYDPPPAFSSPPTSPKPSPSISGLSQPNNLRLAPSPGPGSRAQTPISPNDLEKFAEQCRAWYYNQDQEAGRAITKIFSTLAPSHRAPFSRVQASIREAYHRSVAARRHAELQAHLSSVQPGASLSAHLRANPRSKEAQKERYEHMERFINTWCTMGMPGTTPFFEALWAVMRLQVIPENLGGAGRNIIEWEFDDAVLKEAAGKNFMLESVELLKGVLAFEEQLSSKHFGRNGLTPIQSQTAPQPLASDAKQSSTVTPIDLAQRGRTASDPFMDTPALSRSVATASSVSSTTKAASEVPPSPATLYDVTTPLRFENMDDDEDVEGEYMRVWTSPDLTDPEILQLLTLFPTFISRRPLPRFPVSKTNRPADIEEGEDTDENHRVRFGTGSMWVSSKQRSDGWEGSWWARFLLWWKRLLC